MQGSKSITLRIISPEKVMYHEVVDHVVLPGSVGEIGIFHQHAPFMTYLKPGTLQIHMQDGLILPVKMRSGLVEFKDDCLTILTRDRDFFDKASESR